MASDRRLITMACLGKMGRWGNQCFQYMFLRSYAQRYNLQYQAHRWVGRLLLGHRDPPITRRLPTYHERHETTAREPQLAKTFAPRGDEVCGRNFQGYAQFHTAYYEPWRDFIRDLFVPVPAVQERLQPAVDSLRGLGKTIVGLHMRRGDTGRLIFYLTPNRWYLEWLEKHWDDYDDPVLLIASETPEDRRAFAKYKPVMSSDLVQLGCDPYRVYNYLEADMAAPTRESMDWFPDWWLLTQCNVLAMGNSTFSYTAAMVARQLQACYRSRLSLQAFERIDPWNDWPLVHEDLRDYPGVADTWYDRNPKWQGGEIQGRT